MSNGILTLSILSLIAGSVAPAYAQATAPPVIVLFEATPSQVSPGQPTRLCWQVTGANSISISPGVGSNLNPNDCFTLSPAATTTFTLTASNAFGTVTATTTVTVAAAGPPQIVQFTASPTSIVPGQTSTLSWVVSNATTITITSIGPVPASGSVTVSPAATTTFTLTASNAVGTVTANTTVTVTAAALPQIVQYTASPTNIVAGQQSTLSWVVSNATTITITSIGPVPASGSVSLAPGVTTAYDLTASNASGTIKGQVTVTVTPAVYVDRKTVDFGTIPMGRQARLMVNVIAPAGATVGRVSAAIGGAPVFSVSIPSNAQAGSGSQAQFDVTSGTITPIFVTFSPSATSLQQTSLTLTTPGPGGSTVNTSLSVRGTGVAVTGMEISAALNAANSMPSMARGTWVAIYGEQLSTITRTWTSGDFQNGALPTSLEGVAVLFNGVPGYVYYVSPIQVNALVPFEVPPGEPRQDDASGCRNLAIQIKTSTAISNSIFVPACDFAPGLFRSLFGTRYYAAAVFGDGTIVGPPGSNSRPAKPGETIAIYATGLGPATPVPANADWPLVPFPLVDPPFQVWIDGQAAPIVYEGQVGPGEYQINVTIPETAHDGDLPIEISHRGVTSGATGSMSIKDVLYVPVQR